MLLTEGRREGLTGCIRLFSLNLGAGLLSLITALCLEQHLPFLCGILQSLRCGCIVLVA